MERFNPFSSISSPEVAPVGANNPKVATSKQQEGDRKTSIGESVTSSTMAAKSGQVGSGYSRTYSTSFPDPFGELEQDTDQTTTTTTVTSGPTTAARVKPEARLPSSPPVLAASGASGRSNSVTASASVASRSVDDQQREQLPGGGASTSRLSRQASGLSSFLSRATSVATSSVDRVGSGVRGAVDTISSQIQSAVPTVGGDLVGSSGGSTPGLGTPATSSPSAQQQSAASYLASKLSSATGQFTSSVTSQSSSSMLTISRQRVILILDSQASTDWAQQFASYRRLTSGASGTSGPTAALNYLLSSASQLTSGQSGATIDGSDLVEQADFKDVSVLANQSSSTATIYVNNSNNNNATTSQSGGRMRNASQQTTAKVIKPEFVVVRQRTKDQPEHLRSIVTALNYCLVPMFEPIEVWNIFQDRQLVFAKLLSVQKSLGREHFPLIPQIFLQTHQDLTNYIQSSTSISLPCLVRIGPLGKGKIKIENLQMLQDFASIMEVSGQSCTLEQFLDVKCDLIVQKLGTSLKVFRRVALKHNQQNQDPTGTNMTGDTLASGNFASTTRQSATRQTSLGSSMLSSIISTASGQLSSVSSSSQHQLLSRRSSTTCAPFERLHGEVSGRYRRWMEAIGQEFDNKLEAFCIKLVVASNDREYIVGLSDCSMDFMGSMENQDEDRRSYVEMIISKMNTLLPKAQSSREATATVSLASEQGAARRPSHEADAKFKSTSSLSFKPTNEYITSDDKRKFASQAQIGGYDTRRVESLGGKANGASGQNRNYGQLGNRSKSVIVNNYNDYDRQPGPSGTSQSSSKLSRRSSDRTDGSTNEMDDLSCLTGADSMSSGQFQARQSSLGQTFLDQTSTAWTSFQKQSVGFFKRLDARGDVPSSTPPMSAKSDKGFDRGFMMQSGNEDGSLARAGGSVDVAERQVVGAATTTTTSGGMARNGFKSQSVDGSAGPLSPRKRPTPPKPPPPPALANRQSSLAAYSTSSPTRRVISSTTTTPTSTPVHTRQNSANIEATREQQQSTESSGRNRVVRQNSALSAFEPFDPEVSAQLKGSGGGGGSSSSNVLESELTSGSNKTMRSHESSLDGNKPRTSLEGGAANPKRSVNYDSASVTSGDSNSTEDTGMGNLEKTFASIFGDKC